MQVLIINLLISNTLSQQKYQNTHSHFFEFKPKKLPCGDCALVCFISLLLGAATAADVDALSDLFFPLVFDDETLEVETLEEFTSPTPAPALGLDLTAAPLLDAGPPFNILDLNQSNPQNSPQILSFFFFFFFF